MSGFELSWSREEPRVPSAAVKDFFAEILQDDFLSLYTIRAIDQQNARLDSDLVSPIWAFANLVVIETSDCLHAFFRLCDLGFQVINAPHYVKRGLLGHLQDSYGNLLVLKEGRSYEFDLLI